MSALERGLLPYRLSICGVAELHQYAGRISHILGILDPGSLGPEYRLHHPKAECREFRFYDIVMPEPDKKLPSERDVASILKVGEQLSQMKVEHLLVHCFAGISRSTAAAAILMAQRNPGREGEVFAALADVRPRAWPNAVMINHADRLLQRRGVLAEALRQHQIDVARRFPEVRTLISGVGRGHELPAEFAEGSNRNEPI